MKQMTFELNEKGSLAGARFCVYILDTFPEFQEGLRRPFVLLCPGGGYERTSDREGEPIVMKLLSMGYHVGVLHYSCAPAVYPTALLELARCMELVHCHAEEWAVEESMIFVQGSSAGGHLAASLGVSWNRPFLPKLSGISPELLRPAGMILCYPVITSRKKYAHEGSFRNLLADAYEAKRKEVSIEKLVTEEMPPCFIWHTFTDRTVPVENSILLVRALARAGVSTEFHLYPEGEHGLSLGDETSMHRDGTRYCAYVQNWIRLLEQWLKKMTVKER